MQKLINFLEKRGFQREYHNEYCFIPENSTCDIIINGWKEPCWARVGLFATIKNSKITFRLGYNRLAFPMPKPNGKVWVEREVDIYERFSTSESSRAQYSAVAGEPSYVDTGTQSVVYRGSYMKKSFEPCYKVGKKTYILSTAYHGTKEWIEISEATPKLLLMKFQDRDNTIEFKTHIEKMVEYRNAENLAKKQKAEEIAKIERAEKEKAEEIAKIETAKEEKLRAEEDAIQAKLRAEIDSIYSTLYNLVLIDSEYDMYYTIVEIYRSNHLQPEWIEQAKDLQYQVLKKYRARQTAKQAQPQNKNKKR